MRRTLFACDIDNTLIVSHRHPHDGWMCVEWLDGREQAFMSPRTLALLPGALAGTLPVLVTTRSAAQYARLRLPAGFDMALTANGADLVVNGVADPLWREQSQALIAPWRDELLRCYERLARERGAAVCRMVDDACLFLRFDGDDPPLERADALAADTALNVAVAGRKIYLLPPPLDKGTAVGRLMRHEGIERCVAAGDGPMDLPMLRRADVAIAPEALQADLPRNARICPAGCVFSEYVLETLAEL